MKHVKNTAVGLSFPTAKCKAHEIGINTSRRLSQLDFVILIHDLLYPGTSRIFRSGVRSPVVKRLTADCWRCGSSRPEARRADVRLVLRWAGWEAVLMGAPPERTAVFRGSSERWLVSFGERPAVSEAMYVDFSPTARVFSFEMIVDGS